MDDKLKVVIVDDDVKRREQIAEYLPQYMETVIRGFADNPNAVIMPDTEGKVPDLVILNGDDEKGKGLYTFDWMRTRSGNADVMSIPVVVITEDEFSDKALDFLEIDDVIFYEGVISEEEIFNTVTEALNTSEFAMEPMPFLYTGEKMYDKVTGLSLRPLGEKGDNRRSLVLTGKDDKLANLEKALERGRKKAEQIKDIISGAVEEKTERAEARRAEAQKATAHVLGKVKADFAVEAEKRKAEAARPKFWYGKGDPLTAGLENIDDGSGVKVYEGEVDPLLAGLDDIDFGDKKVRVYDSNIRYPAKKVILVVDDSQEDRDGCEVYLSQKYEVVLVDSGYKAIEYFDKNIADLILLDTYMPNLGGVQTLDGIREKPNGKDIPVVFMVDKRYPVNEHSLSGDNIIGTLQKPIKMGGLVIAVDGFFRSRK